MYKFIIPFVLIIAAIFLTIKFANKIPNKCLSAVGTATVAVKDDSFSPQDITIKKCTKVVFKNETKVSVWPASDLHPTHGIYPEFDPLKGYGPGESWSFVFNKIGRWRYHNHLKPEVRGTITVTE